MLRRVNIVYEMDYNDADILWIPSNLANDIDDVAQEFFRWVGVPENGCRFLVKGEDGHEVLNIDTEEFLWWLNHIKITNEPKATIAVQHTSYDPHCPIAYF